MKAVLWSDVALVDLRVCQMRNTFPVTTFLNHHGVFSLSQFEMHHLVSPNTHPPFIAANSLSPAHFIAVSFSCQSRGRMTYVFPLADSTGLSAEGGAGGV